MPNLDPVIARIQTRHDAAEDGSRLKVQLKYRLDVLNAQKVRNAALEAIRNPPSDP